MASASMIGTRVTQNPVSRSGLSTSSSPAAAVIPRSSSVMTGHTSFDLPDMISRLLSINSTSYRTRTEAPAKILPPQFGH